MSRFTEAFDRIMARGDDTVMSTIHMGYSIRTEVDREDDNVKRTYFVTAPGSTEEVVADVSPYGGIDDVEAWIDTQIQSREESGYPDPDDPTGLENDAYSRM